MERKTLVKKYGRLYSEELGIDLSLGSKEIFKWYLASVLFGAPISENVAKKTFLLFNKSKVNTPGAILKTGWRGLVGILDNGGYARYDFKTADKLLAMAKSLNESYSGDLNVLHKGAKSEADLESKLMLAKGIGSTTIEIFLREMQGIWKVNPGHTPLARQTAKNLGITLGKRFDKRLDTALVRYAHANKRKIRES